MSHPSAETFDSLEAFHADRPERQSPQVDFGCCWHNGRVSHPMWRVSYIQATGEVYAVRLDMRAVVLLGVVEPDREGCYYATVDKILEGWAQPVVQRLSWVKARLADKSRALDARFPRPTPQTAAEHVGPFRGIGGGWSHDDPAEVCPTTGRRHKHEHTAQSCEYNSQLILWKRNRAAYREQQATTG